MQNRAPDSCTRQGQTPAWVPTRFPPRPPPRPGRVSATALSTACLLRVLLIFNFLKQDQILSLNLTFACAPRPPNPSPGGFPRDHQLPPQGWPSRG